MHARGIARVIASTALVAFALAGCGDEDEPPAGEIQEIADHVTEDVFVGTGLAGGRQRFHVPATSLSVNDSEGDTETAVSGIANLRDESPIELGQVQPVGSNSKVVTAVLVMRLVEEGRLDLEGGLPEIARFNRRDSGRLHRLVSEFEHKVRDVTLHELLNHTSGLASWDDTDQWAAAFARDPLQRWRLAQVTRYGLENPPVFPPGAKGKWNYSNTDYTLLGMVLEAVTGVSVERQMADLFDEVDMDRSYYAPTPSEVRRPPISEHLIHGYMPVPPPSEKQPAVLVEAFDRASTVDAVAGHPRAVETVSSNPKASGPTVAVKPATTSATARVEGHGKFTYRDVTHAYGFDMGLSAGGIVSNTEDLARFWRALFDDELVEPETLRIMQETVPVGEAQPEGVTERWGIGFGHQEIAPGRLFEGSPGYSVWYHLGNIFGYSSASYFVEEEDLVVTSTVDIFPQPVGDLGVLRDVLRAQARDG